MSLLILVLDETNSYLFKAALKLYERNFSSSDGAYLSKAAGR